MGRFINADNPCNLGGNSDFVSTNLYAFCGNNPGNRTDKGGDVWEVIVIGAIVGALVGGLSAAQKGGDTGDVLIATLEGAATGGLCAAGGGWLFAGAALHGVYSALNSEGNASTRLFIGLAEFGSTLFWGHLGFYITSNSSGVNSILEAAVVAFNFAVAAEATNYVIESNIDVEDDFIGKMIDKILPNCRKRKKKDNKRPPFYKEYYRFEAVAI